MRNIKKKSQKLKEINLKNQNTWCSPLFLHTVIDNNSKTRYLLFDQDKKNILWKNLGGHNMLIQSEFTRFTRTIINTLVPTPLPWLGTSSTRQGCPKPYPTCP